MTTYKYFIIRYTYLNISLPVCVHTDVIINITEVIYSVHSVCLTNRYIRVKFWKENPCL